MSRKLKGGAAHPVWLIRSDNQEIDSANPLPVEGIVSGGAVSDTNPLPTTTEPPIDIMLQPTIQAAAYVAGDALGGLLIFANAARVAGSGGFISKVVIIDDDGQNASIDLKFFNQTFTPTADNAPFDPSNADLENGIGYIDVAATDYASYANNSEACKASGLRMPFDYDLVGTSLFAQMVIRDGATYTTTSSLTVKITVQRK